MVPCMVIRARYCSPVMMSSLKGSLASGQARWNRISTERYMPMNTDTSASMRY